MAKTKRTLVPVNDSLVEIFTNARPKNPAVSEADKRYLRTLKKRGFTDEELITLAKEAGLIVTTEMLQAKQRIKP
jgi:hypothetical protein